MTKCSSHGYSRDTPQTKAALCRDVRFKGEYPNFAVSLSRNPNSEMVDLLHVACINRLSRISSPTCVCSSVCAPHFNVLTCFKSWKHDLLNRFWYQNVEWLLKLESTADVVSLLSPWARNFILMLSAGWSQDGELNKEPLPRSKLNVQTCCSDRAFNYGHFRFNKRGVGQNFSFRVCLLYWFWDHMYTLFVMFKVI